MRETTPTPGDRLRRHKRIAVFFSGGKDSLACVYLLREFLDRLTIYHADTGDQLPEVRECVAAVEAFAPNFVRVQTDVARWIEEHGLPTDLLPYAHHLLGQLTYNSKTRLVSRFDCCLANLMVPLWRRAVEADGCTLVVRGNRRSDFERMPALDGEVHNSVELYYPLQDWTDEQVFNFLRAHGVTVSRIYEHMGHMVDCASCPAWWNERRGAYLRQHHPAKYRIYDRRLQQIIDEIALPLAQLKHEAELG